MTDHGPEHIGSRPLAGYVMRDYEQLVATLARSRESQGISITQVAASYGGSKGALSESLRGIHEFGGARLFALAHALGYDLALIPREDA